MPTLALWKPYDHVSQFTPRGGHPGLAGLVPVPGVHAVGRLDHDSEGLLILSDDGRLARRLLEPRFGHARTYWTQVERVPTDEALARLRRGVVIGGETTRPARVSRLDGEAPLPPRPVPIRFRKNVPTTWLELTITEGKNRQVRRMTAAVGHPTLRLVRVAIGGLRLLDLDLAPGRWRALDANELSRLLRPSR